MNELDQAIEKGWASLRIGVPYLPVLVILYPCPVCYVAHPFSFLLTLIQQGGLMLVERPGRTLSL